ncbi:glycosyl transferase family 90-domain-containing protein [Chytriomyces sp. MP71]|nr:glycosyl transferase family 90-domain-containing protein [Chytriomyces sp. MP71]
MRVRTRLTLVTLVSGATLFLYLFYSTPDYASADPVASNRRRYRQLHRRAPPPNFDAWTAHAASQQCLTDPSAYAQIYADLAPWLRRSTVAAGSTQPVFGTMQVRFNGTGFEWGASPYNNADPALFDSLAHLLPAKEFRFLVNLFDEPRVVPADDGAAVPYRDMDNVFERNTCFRRQFGTPGPHAGLSEALRAVTSEGESIRSQHGFLLHPDSFVVENMRFPLFSNAKTECFDDIVIPLHYHYFFADPPVHDPIPWEAKQTVLFWRGATTGGKLSLDTPWRKYGRIRLMQWLQSVWMPKHPGSTFDASQEQAPLLAQNLSVDLGFNEIVQEYNPEISEAIEREFGLKGRVEFDKAVRFKYLLVVDGNSWPSRLQQYLQTNSVVLYNGIFTDFYTANLKPMVHYVPIKLDYSDLEEKMDWLQQHDEEAQKIVQNAQELLRKWGNMNQMRCYIALLLLEYSNLFKSEE